MEMSTPCLLDQLPVELLHEIFNYFSASELFSTFFNVNDYVNAILRTYSEYHLDLKFISKSVFHRICGQVPPERVISLTLSDGDETPSQSEAFFSCFQIEQFIRLRSLTLVEIEINSLDSILPNLHKLDQLRTLLFNDRSIRYQYRPLFASLPSYLARLNKSVLSQLNRLHWNDAAVLISIPLLQLRYLKLETCSRDDLPMILCQASQLRSLCVCMDLKKSHFKVILPPNQLIELSLEIKSNSVRFKRKHSVPF